MREVTVESALVDEAERAGGRAYKWASPGNAGIPDRIVVVPTQQCPCCGRRASVGAVELKRPGEVLRPLQQRQLETLQGLGMPAGWADTPAKARAFVRSLQ